jgi:hypothetical protein
MEASSKGPAAGGMPTRRGNIGRHTFELAHNLIREGKKPTEAFAIVAENIGRSAATVATAYYRVACTIPGGAGVKQRTRRGRRATATPAVSTAQAPRRSATTTNELLRRLVDSAAALAQHVERLEKENTEYRQIAAALERLQRTR